MFVSTFILIIAYFIRYITIKASAIDFSNFGIGLSRRDFFRTEQTFSSKEQLLSGSFTPRTTKVLVMGFANIYTTKNTARLHINIGDKELVQSLTNSTSMAPVFALGFATVVPGQNYTFTMLVSPQDTNCVAKVPAYQTFSLGVIEVL